MSDSHHKVIIDPDGREIPAKTGRTIKAALADAGFYFPQNCGGKGQCGHCRVEYQSDSPAQLPREIELLGHGSPYRFACLHKVRSDIHIKLPAVQEWLIGKNIEAFDFAGLVAGGCGIAVDLGTTVVALYLVDFESGQIVDQYSFLNPQVHLGGDVMTRLDLAKDEQNRRSLTNAIRKGMREGISELLIRNHLSTVHVTQVYVAGNTTMTHLFLGRGGEGLECAPFRSPLERQPKLGFDPAWLDLPDNCNTLLCPVIQGFIGGDTAAAIVATDLDQEGGTRLLIDLGTNGEIVLADNGSLYAASTAAGPAFEGVGLHDGMPAVKGAIEGFGEDGELFVIGGGAPVGFCGSGYISTIAYLLNNSTINYTGLLDRNSKDERKWQPVKGDADSPAIVQDDIRKFQLAKGAIAAGIEILCQEAGITPEEFDEIIVTGSFGNRIDIDATMDVGLIPELSPDKITFVDNAAGRGALLCLGNGHFTRRVEQLQSSVKVLNLGDHPDFQEIYVSHMHFNQFKD